ncbi:hypothetical protein [Pseudomonas orientalis]|uniref:Lipoprotein n=1 Tax=Pseudomonas orientalis TaxID=76758 RepID=A0A1H2EI11_9PSED|nr:hypothetical protein [Pseudomonas orientalis]KRP63469.1 hypothetical protein TU82_20690 [Pseudomonas orientalis]SDT94782.1 hypothetical protein SAMN04490197_1269 [Pseudomonas orientalis]
MANRAIVSSPANLLGALLVSAAALLACLPVGSAGAQELRAMCLACDVGFATDATKWVKNGMYRLDAVTLTDDEKEMGAEADEKRKMTRIKPLVLGIDENDALVQASVDAIDAMGNSGRDSTVLEQQWPDLTRRARYAYSLFMAEDQPVDFYKVYVRVGRNQYMVTVGRDVESGEFKMRPGHWRFLNEYGNPGSPEEVAQFKKVEAAARR